MFFKEVLGKYYKDWDGNIVSKNIVFLKIIEFKFLLRQLVSESSKGLLDTSAEYLEEKFISYFGKTVFDKINNGHHGEIFENKICKHSVGFFSDHVDIWNDNRRYLMHINELNLIELGLEPFEIYNESMFWLIDINYINLSEYSNLHRHLEDKRLLPYLNKPKIQAFFKQNYIEQNDKNSPPINIIFLSNNQENNLSYNSDYLELDEIQQPKLEICNTSKQAVDKLNRVLINNNSINVGNVESQKNSIIIVED